MRHVENFNISDQKYLLKFTLQQKQLTQNKISQYLNNALESSAEQYH